jgi:hypothetical protein
MNINDVISNVEKIFRMEPELRRLREEVVMTREAYDAEPTGIKRTLARCRMSDAQKALEAHVAAMGLIDAILPPRATMPLAEFCRAVARARIRGQELMAQKANAEAELVTVQESGKANDWKWKGRGDPPLVVIARKKIAELEAQIADHAASVLEMEAYVAEEMSWTAYTEELAAWTPGTSLPERYRVAEAARIEQMAMEMDVIRLPKRCPDILMLDASGLLA